MIMPNNVKLHHSLPNTALSSNCQKTIQDKIYFGRTGCGLENTLIDIPSPPLGETQLENQAFYLRLYTIQNFKVVECMFASGVLPIEFAPCVLSVAGSVQPESKMCLLSPVCQELPVCHRN